MLEKNRDVVDEIDKVKAALSFLSEAVESMLENSEGPISDQSLSGIHLTFSWLNDRLDLVGDAIHDHIKDNEETPKENDSEEQKQKEDAWIINCSKEETDSLFIDTEFIESVLTALGDRIRESEDSNLFALTVVARQKIDSINNTLLK